MDNNKDLFNIPTIINIHNKEYNFLTLDIHQSMELEEFCSDAVKKEIKKDAKDIGLEEKELMNILNSTETKLSIHQYKAELSSIVLSIKMGLSKNHSEEEINNLINSISVEDIYDIANKLADARIKCIEDSTKKKGLMSPRKKKISPSK